MTRRYRFSSEQRPASPSRRAFLRGVGVSVGLPALASLTGRRLFAGESGLHGAGAGAAGIRADAATAVSGAPLRMAFMSIPNGVHQDYWFPSGEGKQFELNRTMAPLQPFQRKLQVIGGLDHANATPGRDGPGDHARASATFLTGARARKTAGNDIYVGVSIDQLAAQRVGHLTRLPSLELTCDSIRNSGSCDSGYACAYQYNLAWSSPTTPVTPEPNPRLVFERLFGAGEPRERRQNYLLRQATQRSVLDFVLEEAASVERTLGNRDRQKLDQYFSGLRDLEQRLTAAERRGDPQNPQQAAPSGTPGSFVDQMNLMYDMLALAFETDSTRVATLLLAYDGSNRPFPELGIVEGHHWLTHNLRKPDMAQKVADIERYYMQQFARFLQKLDSIEDSDGHSMLDNSMIVYGGAIADGNRHTHENLPLILAGGGGGRLETGRFFKAPSVPMANLFVGMLDQFGIPTEQFGDSTGRLAEI